MSDTNKEIQRAVILRLSGISREAIRALPAVQKLTNKGVTLELEPSLITDPQNLEYQALTGRSPASFGFFDTLMPACHLPRMGQTASDYTVIEEHGGRDTTPALLPDLVQNAGWNVEQAVCSLTGLGSVLQHLLHNSAQSHTCLFLHCVVEAALFSAEGASALQAALQMVESWVDEHSLIAVFAETQPTHIQRFVNINNFLADMGILERDAQTDAISWADSLAYYAGNGQLWINVLGRDPQGVVQLQDEYEEVRDTLVNALPNKLRDPQTDEAVIERVYHKEEVYNGNFLFCAPDLVVKFKQGYAASPRSRTLHFDEATFTTPSSETTIVAGTHPSSLQGFLFATAPTLASGVEVSSQLISAAPTLLHALGIPYVGLEGSPVEDAFSYSYLQTHPIKQVHDQDLSEEDEELVINRLRDLGYI